MIKLFEDFKNHLDIVELCEKYGIENYTINEDLSVDVDGPVNLSNKKLTHIPINFNKVSGTFSCDNNNLIDLTNSPKIVGQNFLCNNNKNISLKNCPMFVLGDFSCMHCNLKELIHLPKIIGRSLFANNNKLISLNLLDETTIGVDIHLSDNKLTNIKGLQNKVNGGLYLSHNKLKNLSDLPETVEKAVTIGFNNITSLKNSGLKNTPLLDITSNKITNLENDFIDIQTISASNNKLTTFEGCPKKLYLLNVYGNKLTSFKGLKDVEIEHILVVNHNNITNLKGIPKSCSGYGIMDNPLPNEILKLAETPKLKDIIKNQDEYSIWNSDGTLNKGRFKILLNDIL